MRTIATCAVCLVLLSVAPAYADDSVNHYLPGCRAVGQEAMPKSVPVKIRMFQCMAIVDAIFALNARWWFGGLDGFCSPEGVTTGQAVQVAGSYVEKMPEQWHFPFAVKALQSKKLGHAPNERANSPNRLGFCCVRRDGVSPPCSPRWRRSMSLPMSSPSRESWILLLRAGAESGVVGGLADWFAVTALFRHPLGLPIPHTAINSQQQGAHHRAARECC